MQITQFTPQFEIIFLAMCDEVHKIHSMVQFQSEESAQKVKNSGVKVWESFYMEDNQAYTILVEVLLAFSDLFLFLTTSNNNRHKP